MDLSAQTKEPFHVDQLMGNRVDNEAYENQFRPSRQFITLNDKEVTNHTQVDEEMDADFKEEIIRLQLRLLEEKLNKERARTEAMKTNHFPEGASMNEYNERLRKALQKQKSIQSQLEDEYYRAKLQRMNALTQLSQTKHHASSRKSIISSSSKSPSSSTSNFDKFMEMMIINQTNAQNMIMNHFMLKSNEQGGVLSSQSQPSFTTPWLADEKRSHQMTSREQVIKPVTSSATNIAEPVTRSSMKTKVKKNYPYPGNDSQRRLRQLGYAALFCSLLDTGAQLLKFKPDSAFMFQVKVREVTNALHRLYLAESGNIFPILRDNCCNEEGSPFRMLIEKMNQMNVQVMKQTAQDVMYIVENLAYQISDIMPVSGILGTQKKAGVYEMITNGQKFTEGYFMNIDLEHLQLDSQQRITNIGDSEAFHILLNVFLIQSFVKTLLSKPRHYRVVADHSLKVEENLRIIGTIFIFIYRRILSHLIANKRGVRKGQRVNTLPEPRELSGFIYHDTEMEPIYKKIKKSIDYAESVLTQWGEQYVSRLRNASF